MHFFKIEATGGKDSMTCLNKSSNSRFMWHMCFTACMCKMWESECFQYAHSNGNKMAP